MDLTAYMGKWYEIARLPMIWQTKECYGIAEYHLNQDGTIGVFNKCEYTPEQDTAVARVTDEPFKLKIKFDQSPVESDYWIELTDYKTYSLVGSPNKEFMWILAREPYMTEYLLDILLTYASRIGYDTSRLIINHRRVMEASRDMCSLL